MVDEYKKKLKEIKIDLLGSKILLSMESFGILIIFQDLIKLLLQLSYEYDINKYGKLEIFLFFVLAFRTDMDIQHAKNLKEEKEQITRKLLTSEK